MFSKTVKVGSSTLTDTETLTQSILKHSAGEESDDGMRTTGSVHFAGSASRASSVFNLANTILGSGALAMPYACRVTGLVMFVPLILAVGMVANTSLGMLICAAEHVNQPMTTVSYPSLAYLAMGRYAERISNWAVIVQQLGACIAYVCFVGDVLQPIGALGASSHDSPLCSRALLQVLVSAVIIFPLCMLRKMDSLRFTSVFALAAIVSLVLVVAVNGLRLVSDTAVRAAFLMLTSNGTASKCEAHLITANTTTTGGDLHLHDELALFPRSSKFFTALPLVCFAFLCHMNAFPIYAELAPPKDTSNGNGKERQMQRVSRDSMTVAACVYLTSGIFGYLTFRDGTEGDLLKNFTVQGSGFLDFFDVLRVGFGLAIIFSYPVVVWEARHGIVHEFMDDSQPLSTLSYFVLNLCVVGGTTIVGIFSPGILVPLGLVGSTCSPLIVFILPPLIYLKLHTRQLLDEHAGVTARSRFVARVILCFGIVLIPVCTVIWAVTTFSSKKS